MMSLELNPRPLLLCGAVLWLGGASIGFGAAGGTRVGAVRASTMPASPVYAEASPFVGVAERVLPGVVSVEAQRWIQHPPLENQGDGSAPVQDTEIPVPSSGSGFVFDERGHIFTNNHVVNGATGIWVHFAGRRRIRAELVGADPSTDVAVLRVHTDQALPVVPLGNSDALRIGDWVAAIGNPLGMFEGSLTVGVVSAKGRNEVSIRGGTPAYQDFIQTDASINFGNSGGPLVNSLGEAIGINTAFSGPGNGIGFAIPISLAMEVAEALIEKGHVVRGYMGVVLQELEPELATALGLTETRGAVLRDVQPNTPASRAGLEPGDVILEMDRQVVADVAAFRLQVARAPVGARVPMTVYRFGQTLQLSVELTQRPDFEAPTSAPSRHTPDGLGLEVAAIPSDAEVGDLFPVHGVVVESVDPEGLAAYVGLRAGDVILSVDGQDVPTPVRFENGLETGRRAQRASVLRVARGGFRWFLALPHRVEDP